eukprot:CAMPEP_0177681272 /NCGR_PEP_ID=MMETSP0447-20121125/30623_1 /TAXON_ID=0 /ORGANISM="Stygamoeba regulata, Strain BSH-02190019" /LENGTH=220 /DNA_ID=CAMNT_0019190669 /DNA_START=108 /DNA_END=766 /DNA_ORIENTATION=+
MAGLQLGDDVVVARPTGEEISGVVRFVGKTEFSQGTWVGVELPEAAGKNDGEVKGVRYFECPENCGLFVKLAQVVSRNGEPFEVVKAEEIFNRLTDPTKYTGSHKQRFDEEGRGKGKAGREDKQEHATKGYVTGFSGGTDKTVSSQAASVTDRLTDPTKFSGSHKHRFTPDGKGRGKEGREDVPDQSGYVRGFKGKELASPSAKAASVTDRLTDPSKFSG